MLSQEQKKQLWDFARENSQSHLYFIGHESHVAWESRRMAPKLDADPDICEISGVLHDLGYSVDPKHHIRESQGLATTALKEAEVDPSTTYRIVHSIATHDAILDPFRVPMENVVMNEVDAGCFFRHYMGLARWMYNDLLNKVEQPERLPKVKTSLLEHAIETETYIRLPLIRREYEEDIEKHKERIQRMTDSNLSSY
ncbi:MAG: hypothetical protein CMH64_03990 [Nanoarchaeota archaeon]|nr:hypothetical protein [Nanoarchaeota archaeon]|tara:strand:+ start:101 stop:694 length:594 start_codon:yes stop_codon:yes gene_type:complete